MDDLQEAAEAAADFDPADSLPVTCPFSIRIDTREQAPWRFTGITNTAGQPIIVPLSTGVALRSGDYSIAGFEFRVAIERKSLSDWFGSITAGRERFEREMERLSQMDYAAVVIEAGWEEMTSSRTVPAASVAGTIAAWSIRYGVHFWPCLHRRHAELWTFRLLEMWWRVEQRNTKERVKDGGRE